MRYVVIKANGGVERHDAKSITRGVLLSHIGQDVESLPVPDGWEASVIAPEKKMGPDGQRLRRNDKATHLLQDVLWPGDNVVGDVLIAGPADDEGEFTSLPAETMDLIFSALTRKSLA